MKIEDIGPCAVILGGQPLNANIVNRIHSLGLQVIVVDFRESILVKGDCHVLADAKGATLGSHLRQIGVKDVRMVYTSMDNAGFAQADICREFGLRHAEPEALTAAHDKRKMHQKWAQAGLLNRESFALGEFDADQICALNKQCRIIIKPVDSCASRGITILDRSVGERLLRKAFDFAKENSDSGLVNVEEFVAGTEFTVEMLGDDYGNVSAYSVSKKYHTDNTDNNKIAVKLHYNPDDVSDAQYEMIADYGRRCYKAIGLKSSLGHLEIILKDDNSLSPVEMGARSSGYIASDLVDIASGRCFLEGLWKVQHGERVFDGVLPRGTESSMYFFYDLPADSVGRRKASILPYLRPFGRSLFHDRQNLLRGRRFPKIQADTDRYGYEILFGARTEFTIERVKRAEAEFLRDFVGADECLDRTVPIFDSITHPTVSGDWLNVRYDGLAGRDELVADMNDYNVIGAVAVGMAGTGGYDERTFVEFCRADKRLVPVAYWDPFRNVDEMESLKELGYCGIKIHPRLAGVPIDSPQVLSAIKGANKHGLVCFCCSFAGITEKFAEATRADRFVLLHSGFEHFDRVMSLMSGSHPGVLFDLSYTLCHCDLPAANIVDAVKRHPSKFCIGSDHPEINALQLRRRLNCVFTDLTDEEKHRLYHRNIEDFIRSNSNDR